MIALSFTSLFLQKVVKLSALRQKYKSKQRKKCKRYEERQEKLEINIISADYAGHGNVEVREQRQLA